MHCSDAFAPDLQPSWRTVWRNGSAASASGFYSVVMLMLVVMVLVVMLMLVVMLVVMVMLMLMLMLGVSPRHQASG